VSGFKHHLQHLVPSKTTESISLKFIRRSRYDFVNSSIFGLDDFLNTGHHIEIMIMRVGRKDSQKGREDRSYLEKTFHLRKFWQTILIDGCAKAKRDPGAEMNEIQMTPLR
jgi:hypothetical protein